MRARCKLIGHESNLDHSRRERCRLARRFHLKQLVVGGFPLQIVTGARSNCLTQVRSPVVVRLADAAPRIAASHSSDEQISGRGSRDAWKRTVDDYTGPTLLRSPGVRVMRKWNHKLRRTNSDWDRTLARGGSVSINRRLAGAGVLGAAFHMEWHGEGSPPWCTRRAYRARPVRPQAVIMHSGARSRSPM